MSNLTDFFPSGGGGLTPKFQEFNSSGTFTPSQALIDAGGYIEVFLVAGGGGGRYQNQAGGFGGNVVQKQMYLNNTNTISVTVGAGGLRGSTGGNGGDSLFQGSTAGGINLTANGGIGVENTNYAADNAILANVQQGLGSYHPGTTSSSSQQIPGQGINGYGGGGPSSYNQYPINGTPNSGQGGVSASSSSYARSGMSGYCLIKWYE